jgi:hypothetical protein
MAKSGGLMPNSITATKQVKPSSEFSAMGFEKEMKQPHGPKVEGKAPLVHSHSAKPTRKLRVHKTV